MESDGLTHVVEKEAGRTPEGAGGDPAWAHLPRHQTSQEPQ